MDPDLEDWLREDRKATLATYASLGGALASLAAVLVYPNWPLLVIAVVLLGVAAACSFWVAHARGYSPWLALFGLFLVIWLPNRRRLEAEIAKKLPTRAAVPEEASSPKVEPSLAGLIVAFFIALGFAVYLVLNL